MTDNNITKYPGKAIDVTWDGRLCIHIGECGKSEGDLFIGGRDPWCQPDLTSVEDTTDRVLFLTYGPRWSRRGASNGWGVVREDCLDCYESLP